MQNSPSDTQWNCNCEISMLSQKHSQLWWPKCSVPSY